MTRVRYNPKANVPAVYIPTWLIQVPVQKLSHGAKILYGRLSQWSGKTGEVYRSKKDLMEEIGVSLRTLGDLIKELKDVNLIDTVQPIKGGISHYIFYNHEWMNEQIKDQLIYKSTENEVVQNPAWGSAESCMGVVQNPAHINININKINNNNKKNINKKNISTSDEAPFIKKNNFDSLNENSKNNNQTLCENGDDKGLEELELCLKSDYRNNQVKNKPLGSNLLQCDINHILSNNIFQIPEQFIFDWIKARKKKRAPVTQTAWNKINKELSKCKENGIDPVEAFETMAAGGWQSLKVEYFINPRSTKPPLKRVDNNDTSWGEHVFTPFHELDL